MRKLLMAALLAGAASPALAQPVNEGDDRASARSDRAAARAEARAQRRSESQQSRAERPQRNDDFRRGPDLSGSDFARPARTRPPGDELRSSRTVEQQLETPGERAQRRVARESMRRGLDGSTVEPRELETPGERAQRRAAGDTVRDWRARNRLTARPDSPTLVEERNLRRGGTGEEFAGESVQPREIRPTIIEGRSGRDSGARVATIEGQTVRDRSVRPAIVDGPGSDLVQQRESVPRTFDPERRRRVSETPQFGAEPPPPASASTTVARPQHRWRHDWRRDHRYDWRDWRRRHRSLFHIGFYYDPFGWNYFRYGIGWRLWPSYYHNRYWLHDPWYWRLPRTYGPYRWIRYHHDALLVNLYTGEVEDVVYDFFW